MMSEDNCVRRSVLKLLGSAGVGTLVNSMGMTNATAAQPEIDGEEHIVRRNGKAFVRSRTVSKPLSRRNIQAIRAKYFGEYIEENELNNDGVTLSLPPRKPIRAYNLGVKDGVIKEFIGYDTPTPPEQRRDRGQSRDLATNERQIKSVFDDANEHLTRISSENIDSDTLQSKSISGIKTNSTGDFSGWNKIMETIERNTTEDYGKFFSKVDCYRYHGNDVKNDAYGIVSFSEMGGGALDGVDDGVINWELSLKHDWENNADMGHDSRYPNSDVTGQTSTTWSAGISISWPPGINVSGSSTYSQDDVQTYDESDPWADIGKWRVSIDSEHTRGYTASVNPSSMADVDRTVEENILFGSFQPVCDISSEAIWMELEGTQIIGHSDTHSITIMDQVEFSI